MREAAGLFDIDRMGQVIVAGPDALSFLQKIQVNDISTMAINDARYSLMCYADGSVIDDIFLYRVAGASWWVIVNASNRKKDVEWMQTHAVGMNVSVTDISDDTYMLALQGPQARSPPPTRPPPAERRADPAPGPPGVGPAAPPPASGTGTGRS